VRRAFDRVGILQSIAGARLSASSARPPSLELIGKLTGRTHVAFNLAIRKSGALVLERATKLVEFLVQ